jgi:hypothetical protein
MDNIKKIHTKTNKKPIIKTDLFNNYGTKSEINKKGVSFTTGTIHKTDPEENEINLNDSPNENETKINELSQLNILNDTNKLKEYNWDRFTFELEDLFNKFLEGKSDTDFVIYNIQDIKRKSLDLLEILFDNTIKEQKDYIEKRKKELQREYEKKLNKSIPCYKLKSCIMCSNSELFSSLYLNTICQHPICYNCLKEIIKLEKTSQIQENDKKSKNNLPYYLCPICTKSIIFDLYSQ